ncbi:transketolase [Treponema primitia]|uniref:transketolase n=1 Tax=Treponema primitia TaxID=88058 RepID=UPI0039811CE4
MEPTKKRQLELQAAKIRKYGLEAIQAANSGHIGGSFSIAEILSVLYFDRLRIDPKNPKKPDRDRFVLSKGHCTPTTYAALALRGFFPIEDLKTFRRIDSYLSGHIEMNHVPGVDMSAGSLGQGFSVSLGMALAGKVDKLDYKVYTVTGDGEIQEGQIWEAAMAAPNFKLNNLRLFVDNNRLQLDGSVDKIMSIYPLEDKFKAFGWHVIGINGNDVGEISDALDTADTIQDKPTVIIAHTIKGKGVSIFENNVKWHGGRPSPAEYVTAYEELNAQIKQLEG